MKLEDMEAIARERTRGEWFDENDSVSTQKGISSGYHKDNDKVICTTMDGEYVENPNYRSDTKFIAMAANHWDKLLEVVKQAKKLFL
jgi:hypothetical protein